MKKLRITKITNQYSAIRGVRLLLAIATTTALLVSCTNSTTPEPSLSTAEKILQEVRARSFKSLIIKAGPAAQAIIDSTSPASKPVNILFYITGGPVHDSTPLTLEAISVQIASNSNYARVIVQQEQMICYANKTLPTNRTITAEEAEEINLTSAAIVYAVGEKFKRMGHKVSLFAHSFGSFLVPEMLLVYGDEPFQKILISAGRLDMPEAIRQNISAGKAAGFELDEHNIATKIQLENQTRREDVEFQIRQDAAKFGGFCSTASKKENPMAVLLCTGNSVDESKKEVYINIELNMFRLMVDSDKPRYTTLLKNKLNKVIYYFGGQDTRVGSLTVREVNALAGKSAASDAGIGSIKFLTPDSSKSVTRNIKLEGQTTPTNVTRTVHTINDASGQPAVRYTLEDGHNLPLLFEHTLDDILKSFGAK